MVVHALYCINLPKRSTDCASSRRFVCRGPVGSSARSQEPPPPFREITPKDEQSPAQESEKPWQRLGGYSSDFHVLLDQSGSVVEHVVFCELVLYPRMFGFQERINRFFVKSRWTGSPFPLVY